MLVAETKKAEGASIATLRIPRPPSLIGRVVFIEVDVDDVSEAFPLKCVKCDK